SSATSYTHPFIFLRASSVSGIFSQNMSASVSLAITACCVSFVNVPRLTVRLIHGMSSHSHSLRNRALPQLSESVDVVDPVWRLLLVPLAKRQDKKPIVAVRHVRHVRHTVRTILAKLL